MTPSRPAFHAPPVRVIVLALVTLFGMVLLTVLNLGRGMVWLLAGVAAFAGIAAVARLARGNPFVLPVLRLDLVRLTRRGRLFLFRAAYAFALLAVLYLLYREWFGAQAALPWDLNARPRISLKETARFAESFFHAFLLAQLAAVFVFTPAYVAGVIAEEKDRRTLEFLFVSDLDDREIVLSKLASRLLHLVLLLLTGLPVLLFATFFGGIDPGMVLAGFLSNGLTMLSLAGTSLLCSVYSERTLTAMLSAYLVAAGHLLCCGLGCAPFWGRGGFYFPLVLLFEGGPLLGVLFSVLLHGWMAATCCHWAGLRLRAWYRIRASGPAKAWALAEREDARRRARPAVGEDALLWKERYFAPGFGLSASARFFFKYGGLALVGYVVLFLLALSLLRISGHPLAEQDTDGQKVFTVVQEVGTAILCALILIAAFRAASSLGSERDRQTLESLLTLPLENRDILAAKWRASLWYVRKGWGLLALVWLLGMAAGVLYAGAVPLLVLAGWVYAVFAVNLGLWFSLVCRTTLRAIIWTLTVLFGMSTVPLLWGPEVYVLLSPPMNLAGLTIWNHAAAVTPYVNYVTSHKVAELGSVLALYLGAAAVLWKLTNLRFGPVTGRMPYGRPPPRSPAARR